MNNIIAIPQSRNSIAEYATAIRKIAGTNFGFFDVVKFIEHQGYEFFNIDLEIVNDDSSKIDSNEYAKFLPYENKIVVRQSVYLGASDGIGIDRFTLAHELGHALLHKRQALSRSSTRPPAYKDPEWQANEFASYVLCPLNEIRSKRLIDIVTEYKVSKQVASIQLKKLGV